MDFSVEFYETTAGTCRIIAVHGIRNKGQAIPERDLRIAKERMRDWQERTKP